MTRWSRTLVVLACGWGLCATAAVAEEAKSEDKQESGQAAFSDQQLEFFEVKIRPLLARHCYECHSGKSKKLQAGLRLDGRQLAIKGGENGAAVVPGKPAESLLVAAVKWESFEMPPKGKLKQEEVDLLVRWVEQGAAWPPESATAKSEKQDHEKQEREKAYDWPALRSSHWAWKPLTRPEPPVVQRSEWPHNAIDQFLLARLEAAGLKPAPPAEPRALIRRIYFDLLGLPPSPAEVDQFVARCKADRPAAVAGLVDRLLESPHYGERWGRHWLDVARYSDGLGGFLDSRALPHAWRYRDWVVQSFNEDLPYNEFIKQQIASDLMGLPKVTPATGFFAIGPTYRSDGGDPESVAQAKAETLADRVDTFSRGVGATVSCARCHDHKFDPIPQLDYYSLAGVFNNSAIADVPLACLLDVAKKYNDHQAKVKQRQKQLQQLDDLLKKEKREASEAEKKQREQWERELKELNKSWPPKYDVAHGLRESGSGDMPLAIRGDLRKPGPKAPRRFLQVLARNQAEPFTSGSGRLQLAEATASSDNPLLARVMVNRIWLHHFGKAIVRSPSNFGKLGQRPTHPLLLEWLSHEFIRSGWSIKNLHRLIMQTAAYQMSAQYEPGNYQADGDNKLVWRMNPQRIDVESWRDALLAVTGELDRKTGGPPTEDMNNKRRTLYFRVSRNGDRFATDEFLRLFDFPLMRASIAKRPTSIVPQQYLFMMNSAFMVDRAKALVQRLDREAESDDERVVLAYRLLYGRGPSARERSLGLAFLSAERPSSETPGEKVGKRPQLSRWRQYAQVLLSSNEFMYRK